MLRDDFCRLYVNTNLILTVSYGVLFRFTDKSKLHRDVTDSSHANTFFSTDDSCRLYVNTDLILTVSYGVLVPFIDKSKLHRDVTDSVCANTFFSTHNPRPSAILSE